MAGEHVSPEAVPVAASLVVVLTTVELNDKSQFHAREIGEVRADRVLASKSKPKQPSSAKVIPETSLSVS
jgi:hypothetical protein